MKYVGVLIVVGVLILTFILIERCQNSGYSIEELLKEKISLIEQATDILYNERTLEGKEKLEKIHSTETELEKKLMFCPIQNVLSLITILN